MPSETPAATGVEVAAVLPVLPDRPLVFTSVGMAWQDLVAATAVAERHGV